VGSEGVKKIDLKIVLSEIINGHRISKSNKVCNSRIGEFLIDRKVFFLRSLHQML
jgi:hypothetical protein